MGLELQGSLCNVKPETPKFGRHFSVFGSKVSALGAGAQGLVDV